MSGGRARRKALIDRAVLAEMWAAGAPLAEIAARFGAHACSVSRAASRAGLPPRARPIDAKRLRRLWQEGRAVAEIAEAMGVTTAGVHSAAKRLKLRRPRQPVPIDTGRIMALHDAGRPVSHIIRLTGYSRQRVRSVIDRALERRAARAKVLRAVPIAAPRTEPVPCSPELRRFAEALRETGGAYSELRRIARAHRLPEATVRGFWDRARRGQPLPAYAEALLAPQGV